MSLAMSLRMAGVFLLVFGSQNAAALQLEWRDAKDWIVSLEKPARLAELQFDRRFAPLNLKPGETIADVGAGAGVFSRALAQAVGPAGKVYAEDIQQALLDHINERSEQEHIENIETVLGAFDDPKLPAQEVDLVWIHDVFHAVEHKDRFLKALASSVKPGGRIAITDWLKTDPNALKFHDSLDILLSEDEAKRLLADVGFHPIKEMEGFTLAGIKQWYIIFARP